MIYINEAHAVDVWPIGLSAGTINYSHKTIQDRASISNEFDETFGVWPFRYYVINWSDNLSQYVFSYIPNPLDSEFDITQLIDKLN